jgi:hypothetical protein
MMVHKVWECDVCRFIGRHHQEPSAANAAVFQDQFGDQREVALWEKPGRENQDWKFTIPSLVQDRIGLDAAVT